MCFHCGIDREGVGGGGGSRILFVLAVWICHSVCFEIVLCVSSGCWNLSVEIVLCVSSGCWNLSVDAHSLVCVFESRMQQ